MEHIWLYDALHLLLIASLVIDAHYLTEDDGITYKLGKKVEANTEKCKRLFGSYWDILMFMDEDEIAKVFWFVVLTSYHTHLMVTLSKLKSISEELGKDLVCESLIDWVYSQGLTEIYLAQLGQEAALEDLLGDS